LSGVAKVWDAGGTRVAVQDFGVPARLAPAISIAVPLLEIAAGLPLPLAATRPEAAICGTVLFCAVSRAMAFNLSAGRTPDCHCFGRVHSKPVSWKTFGLTSGLTGIAAWLAWSTPAGLKLEELSFEHSAPFLAAAVLFGLTCIVGGWIFTLLMQQQGR